MIVTNRFALEPIKRQGYKLGIKRKMKRCMLNLGYSAQVFLTKVKFYVLS